MANIYKGSFVNTQVDYSDNSPNEQTIYLTITDLVDTTLPYGLNYWVDPSIGDNQQLMNVSWTSLPTGTDELIIGYRLEGAVDWTDITLTNPDLSGFYQWIVAFGSYEIRFRVIIGATEEIYYDYPPTEIELEMADSPIVFQTVDNSEDKFTPIKSKSCTIRVLTNDEVNAMAFANGGDSQYKVQVAVGAEDKVIFTGWLSISDLGQTFQPDPNILVLTATDGLGFLRDLPMSDDAGRFLTGPHPLIKYIAWALQKTGIQLDIWVQMNILEENAIYDYIEYHFYNNIYLNAQTFEAEIGTLESCFSVLEKILGEFCELSQDKNRWFIKSIDEAGNTEFRIGRFDYNGTPIDYQTKNYLKLIGPTEDMAFMNDDARLSLQRPYKAVEQTFDYNYPIEIIENIAFDRGDLIDGSNPLEKTYELDNWTVIQGVPGYYAAPTSQAYINRVFNTFDYETDRYVVITPKSGQSYSLNLQTYARSEAFYIQEKDRFSVSIDWRLPNNIGPGGNGNCDLMKAVLHGDDGSWWILGVPTSDSLDYTWYDTNNWTTNTGKASVSVDFDIDLTEWQSVSWEAPACPTDGKLYIWINQFNQLNTTNDDVDIWYSNLNFSYIPYINGSYQRYSGQRHISEQSVDNKAVRENTIYMTDSPKKEIKGAMLRAVGGDILYNASAIFEDGNGVTLDGFQTPYFDLNQYIRITNTSNNNGTFRIIAINYSTITNKTVLTFVEATQSESTTPLIEGYNYLLTDAFYDSIKYPGGGVPPEDIYPYGQHQNQAVWNQFNRVFTAFEATVDGLETDVTDTYGLPDLPDLMHCYMQTDPHPATDKKQFKVLHYEQDTDNCEWGLYMIEVNDTNILKSYDGHSFKYVQK
jgi:hypothetical protein